MQAVIMAAGEGVRMRPLTLLRPKPLIEVAGKPLIEHMLDVLPSEIDEVIIVIGYLADMIRARVGQVYRGLPIRYAHQWMRGGTAHALSIARPFLSGRFLLLNADDISGAKALAEAVIHPLSILATPHPEPHRFGVIIKRPDGTLDAIIEKPEHPPSNLVSTGAMVLDERIFGYPVERRGNGEYYLTDPVSALAREHKMMVIEQPLWLPVGCPEDIAKAETTLRRGEKRG